MIAKLKVIYFGLLVFCIIVEVALFCIIWNIWEPYYSLMVLSKILLIPVIVSSIGYAYNEWREINHVE